jgi:hypothetical protein
MLTCTPATPRNEVSASAITFASSRMRSRRLRLITVVLKLVGEDPVLALESDHFGHDVESRRTAPVTSVAGIMRHKRLL